MTAPRILITRAEPSTLLEEAGFRTSCFPVLEILARQQAQEEIAGLLGDNTVLITTSQHALPVLAEFPAALSLPLAVVGKASGAAAKRLGFSRILEGGGTVERLLPRLRAEFSPSDGALLYVRGQEISRDITSELRAEGYAVQEVIAYEARPATALPPLADIHAIAVYSRRGVQVVESLIDAEISAKLTLVCFSESIAEAANPALWDWVLWAESPTEEAMCELFMGLYGTPPRIRT